MEDWERTQHALSCKCSAVDRDFTFLETNNVDPEIVCNGATYIYTVEMSLVDYLVSQNM